MNKFLLLTATCFFSISLCAQSIESLRNELKQLISTKNTTVGISIKGLEDHDTLSINGNVKMPLLSVFKFHIALTVLDQVDRGKLKLDQKFFIKKEDLLPNTWSPIREAFPNGNIDLTLDQLLRYTVSHSDNNGCDLLLKIIGGTEIVQEFINKNGIADFTIQVNEQQMATWENLYLNTSTPLAMTQLLEKFYKGKILKSATTKYLFQRMVETSRGITWMKAGFPEHTEVAHRTGASGVNKDNLRVAMNDVGIVKLPNGKHFILSVFLKNTTEEQAVTEKILADIAKATWNYYLQKN